MDNANVAALLPVHIPVDAFADLQPRSLDSLGGHAIIFKRVPGDAPSFIGWPDIDDGASDTRRWAADCRCTACGDSFRLGWRSTESREIPKKRVPGVLMCTFGDGATYPGVPSDADSEFVDAYDDNDLIDCPSCNRTVRLKHYSHFRSYGGGYSKTYQTMWGTVHNAGNLTAIVYWLASRTVTANANASLTVKPQYALVIDAKLRYFIYKDGWQERRNIADPSQRFYYSAEAAFYKKVGAFFARNIPDLTGMSGEKTGIAEYLKAGGEFPMLYLKFWKVWPQIENLVKCGWARTINDCLDGETYAALSGGGRVTFPQALQEMVDWNETSPAKMLSMTRPEVRAAAKYKWHADTLTLWTDGAASGAFRPGGAKQFDDDVKRFGLECLRDWLRLRAQGDCVPFDKLKRYLARQNAVYGIELLTAFRMFYDYRDMLRQIGDATGTQPDNVELLPKNLRFAHDRAAAQVSNLKSKIDAQKFLAVRETWQGLEYSDGAICSRLPQSESELVQEGRTLHICIGAYGNQHLRGHLIIFIRHARRPERSWYALNLDVTGREPRRIQLHGYCNDYAHGRPIPIPQAVRDFCDRLESVILPPVLAAVRAGKKAAAT